MQHTHPQDHADFDVVGRYSQDAINGFDNSLLDHLVSLVEPAHAECVLDAMAGNGNLTARLIQYCRKRGLSIPRLTVFDYSKVQLEQAQRDLDAPFVDFFWGDITTLRTRDGARALPHSSFDRVMIKSANHELPLDAQDTLYKNVFALLKDGGRFVNLGFLFDNEEERDEFRRITRVKDYLAGLTDMVKNRHFLTRDEFHGALAAAGFTRVVHKEPITYSIDSAIAARHYFPPERRDAYETLLQVAQVKARALRQHGRITFPGTSSMMVCPGEITVVEKPAALTRVQGVYEDYPYDLLLDMRVYRELLAAVVEQIHEGATVLDLGCGPGFLREALGTRPAQYVGIDASREFIARCQERFYRVPNTFFSLADLNEVCLLTAGYDAVCLLNVVYQESIGAEALIAKAVGCVREGGLVCISGPSSPTSFATAAPAIEKQLYADGVLPLKMAAFREVGRANERLLSPGGHYFSATQVVNLLRDYGCTEVVTQRDDIYYGTGYLVIAQRAA